MVQKETNTSIGALIVAEMSSKGFKDFFNIPGWDSPKIFYHSNLLIGKLTVRIEKDNKVLTLVNLSPENFRNVTKLKIWSQFTKGFKIRIRKVILSLQCPNYYEIVVQSLNRTVTIRKMDIWILEPIDFWTCLCLVFEWSLRENCSYDSFHI
jgi:hypothetical protein